MQQILDSIRRYARENNIPVILDDTRKFLEDLCAKLQPKRILEVGMAIGYSASCMLKSCNANIVCFEASLPNIEIAKQNFEKLKLTNRVKIVVGDCLKTLPDYKDEKFDLIFLDGPKAKYKEIFDLLLPHLNKNGVLVADNVLFRGMVLDNKEITENRFFNTVEHLKDFINYVKSKKEIQSEIKHIGDGLCVVQWNERG